MPMFFSSGYKDDISCDNSFLFFFRSKPDERTVRGFFHISREKISWYLLSLAVMGNTFVEFPVVKAATEGYRRLANIE
jgi:hypothetical protein